MDTPENIKKSVKEKYGEIALQSLNDAGCCCGCGPNVEYTIMSDEYSEIEGYVGDADLKLGCGIPTEFADIKPGDYVLDLGSGAGNDVFVARKIVGDAGKVVGLDMTQAMIDKANTNLNKTPYNNVEFVLGEIENMPFDDAGFDAAISNCVINLVPDKNKAFSEVFRVLKPNGRFCFSDIVVNGEFPEELRTEATLYAGCISGAMKKEDYLNLISDKGFADVQVKKTKAIQLPKEMLQKYVPENLIPKFYTGEIGLESITVTAKK
eukprot:TRINITY_DN29053_c0_g1_i1.p1 TRINITY_DN29053_c0_g1~~TRINITY_DN29053_c0_g1_i1.p1  ORF type:complete len:265 (+),score=-19.58 TRINITY_DN29053_c0_g1_i1:444-1238(+)